MAAPVAGYIFNVSLLALTTDISLPPAADGSRTPSLPNATVDITLNCLVSAVALFWSAPAADIAAAVDTVINPSELIDAPPGSVVVPLIVAPAIVELLIAVPVIVELLIVVPVTVEALIAVVLIVDSVISTSVISVPVMVPSIITGSMNVTSSNVKSVNTPPSIVGAINVLLVNVWVAVFATALSARSLRKSVVWSPHPVSPVVGRL
ncbi:hypothetical protein [Ferrovibrio sp.]|uniref:hypothetical protein n=1 Tax=Ferrovibrio sp. TaxID=1917215 RepID=UPI0025C58255|nr:hypothetical protein [Ferrovibrio sp.]